jgi:hypothetical protein
MNIDELKVALDSAGVGCDAGWQDGEFIAGHMALSQKSFGKYWTDGKWRVYYVFRGEKIDRWCFDSESEACENLLRRTLRILEWRNRYGQINKKNLKTELDREGVSPRAYDLDNMKSADSRVVLKHGFNRQWSVYYDDRGNKLGLISFDSESAACEHLLDRLLSMIERFGANQWG